MLRSFGLLLVLIVGAGPALASLSSLVSAWGHDFTVTPFETKEVMVAVATDKTTGAKFNVVKMPNGHLMTPVPLGGMKEPPKVDPADLM